MVWWRSNNYRESNCQRNELQIHSGACQILAGGSSQLSQREISVPSLFISLYCRPHPPSFTDDAVSIRWNQNKPLPYMDENTPPVAVSPLVLLPLPRARGKFSIRVTSAPLKDCGNGWRITQAGAATSSSPPTPALVLHRSRVRLGFCQHSMHATELHETGSPKYSPRWMRRSFFHFLVHTSKRF